MLGFLVVMTLMMAITALVGVGIVLVFATIDWLTDDDVSDSWWEYVKYLFTPEPSDW
jgi:hypothetical protein